MDAIHGYSIINCVYIYNHNIYYLQSVNLLYISHVYIYIYILYTHGLPGNLEHTQMRSIWNTEKNSSEEPAHWPREQVRDKLIAGEWM